MTDPNQMLDDIRIASPCTASWNEMTGTDTVRFCGECNRNVFNISNMTAVEAAELIERGTGRLCVRLYQRKDGTVLTRDCPVGFRAAVGRATRAAGAVMAAVLGLFSGIAVVRGEADAQQGDGETPATCTVPQEPRVKMGKIAVRRHGDVEIVVKGVEGSALVDADVVLMDLRTGESVQAERDGSGRYVFERVKPGPYSLTVVAPGHDPVTKTVRVERNRQLQLDVVLPGEEYILMGEIAPVDQPESTETITPEPEIIEMSESPR